MYVTLPSEPSEIITVPHLPAPPPQTPSQKGGHTWKTGQSLYHEGDTAKRVYEIVSGVLRLSRVLENGRRQVIAFGYPGDIVGFPCNGKHHTECDVIAKAEVISHNKDALENGEGDPALHERLIAAALNEISAMQDHFMMLGRKKAHEKIASFLMVLNQRVGVSMGSFSQFHLPMSRSDIADFLGLTTETVSRTITHFRKSGIIALDGVQTVVVLDPAALQEMSEGE